ncbi:hypothetical protein BpHYR1_015731, partial [Brachionus plicatilis]
MLLAGVAGSDFGTPVETNSPKSAKSFYFDEKNFFSKFFRFLYSSATPHGFYLKNSENSNFQKNRLKY